jgi:hypothetical protein
MNKRTRIITIGSAGLVLTLLLSACSGTVAPIQLPISPLAQLPEATETMMATATAVSIPTSSAPPNGYPDGRSPRDKYDSTDCHADDPAHLVTNRAALRNGYHAGDRRSDAQSFGDDRIRAGIFGECDPTGRRQFNGDLPRMSWAL